MIITIHEHELVPFFNCGTATERELFSLINPRTIIVLKDGIKFQHPGVYRIGPNSPIFLVFPVFFKNNSKELGSISGFRLNEWLDLIYSFSKHLEEAIVIEGFDQKNMEWEPILFSMLSLTTKLLDEELKKESFGQKNQVSTSISGKWNISKDVRRFKKPLNFNCTINIVKNDNIILGAFKFIFRNLMSYTSSKANMGIINDTYSKLGSVDEKPLGAECLQGVKSYINKYRLTSNWLTLIEFYYNLLNYNQSNSVTCGLSVRFPMDSFFEYLVENILVKIGFNVSTQVSVDVLGGSRWVNGDSGEVALGSIKSRPDLVATQDGRVSIVEVKYKFFKFPTDIGPKNKKSFLRGDRNQVLSFVLSHLSSSFIVPPEFFIFYPIHERGSIESCCLEFPRASLEYSEDCGSIIVGNSEAIDGGCLSVKFIGINIISAIRLLNGRDLDGFGEAISKRFTATDQKTS